MPLKVALLGRPNVGKSTLFNRLIRSRRAITHDRPGITRDRMEGRVKPSEGEPFFLIDTGGVTLDQHQAVTEGPEGLRGFEQEILRQTEAAMQEASVFCLVVDGRAGLLPLDEHLALFVRRAGKPILLVVNKVDGPEREDEMVAEFHALGFPLMAVSAEHGYNVRALEDEIANMLSSTEESTQKSAQHILPDDSEISDNNETTLDIPDNEDDLENAEDTSENQEKKSASLKLALLGRPNAGKSSLINALIGEERMIVSEMPGTTRDSVDVSFTYKGHPCVFVDTAGVRRRTKITDTVERYSVNSSLKSTTKSDVTLYVIDAVEGVTSQDKRLIDLLNERKTPFLVLANKIDLISKKGRAALERDFREMLEFCPHVPVLTVSAKQPFGLGKIIPMAVKIHEECQKRISTGMLNRAMKEVLMRHQPPLVNRVRPKFFYLTQAETAPPTFVFFVSDAERVSETYVRYLERSLRQYFGILHAPMRLRLRSSHKKEDT